MIQSIESVYFIGIGGIGMSALARYFLSHHINVGGYDRTATELTQQLVNGGAKIHYDMDVASILPIFKERDRTLIVYTPAISRNNTELDFFVSNGFRVLKRAQVLGELTKAYKGLCVAGTHGKTTTSTMLAHLLHQSSVGCNAFLGGISKNYGTNYLLCPQSPYVVIEADEFDRSFHWLRPFATVITAVDPDHLDIYGTKEEYIKSFEHYTTLIQSGGSLILHEHLSLNPKISDGVNLYRYGRNDGDFHAEQIRIGNGRIVFDYVSPFGNIKDIELGVPIGINIENGIAAMALAQIAGVSTDEIKKGMLSFKGVDRRFDFKIKTDQCVLLSDYAHHPEEIKQSILSIKEVFSHRKITVIFQPHLYSRTRDFYKEFAASLSLADQVVLVAIYPARETPIPGITSQLIYDNLESSVEKEMCKKEDLPQWIQHHDVDVLLLLGAGDIDNYSTIFAKELRNRMGSEDVG